MILVLRSGVLRCKLREGYQMDRESLRYCRAMRSPLGPRPATHTQSKLVFAAGSFQVFVIIEAKSLLQSD